MTSLRVAPILEQMVQDFVDQVIMRMVNVHQQGTISQRFGISGIPAIVMFRDGQVVDRRSETTFSVGDHIVYL